MKKISKDIYKVEEICKMKIAKVFRLKSIYDYNAWKVKKLKEVLKEIDIQEKELAAKKLQVQVEIVRHEQICSQIPDVIKSLSMPKSVETFCNVKLNPTTWIPNKLKCSIEVKLCRNSGA